MKACAVRHPTAGHTVSWIGEVSPGMSLKWGLGCVLCYADGAKTALGAFRVDDVTMMKANRLKRHEDSERHKAALEAWTNQPLVDKPQAATSQVVAQPNTLAGQGKYSVGDAHILAMLQTVRENGSAKQFTSKLELLRKCEGQAAHGFDGRTSFLQLRRTCAGMERAVTKKLVQSAACVAVQQDGREPFLGCLARLVIWKKPKLNEEDWKRAAVSLFREGVRHGSRFASLDCCGSRQLNVQGEAKLLASIRCCAAVVETPHTCRVMFSLIRKIMLEMKTSSADA